MASAEAAPAASPAAPAAAPVTRLPLRTVVASAVVVALVRPVTWVVALAGFLAGGGVIVLAWPILVLPTPSGIQNLLGAPISTLAFGSPSGELVRFVATSAAAATTLIVGGLLAGAWAERRGIALVLSGAADEGFAGPAPDDAGAPGLLGIALVRGAALIPPLAMIAAAWPTLYGVAYKELILPEDLATPLPVRIAAQVPLVLAAVAVTWLLADAASATGVRRLVVERCSVRRAWAMGWVELVRRPGRIITIAVLGDLAVVLAAGPVLLAAALAWGRVREALEVAPSSPIGLVVAVLWVGIWLASLVLAGVGAAVRAALFTMESARPR